MMGRSAWDKGHARLSIGQEHLTCPRASAAGHPSHASPPPSAQARAQHTHSPCHGSLANVPDKQGRPSCWDTPPPPCSAHTITWIHSITKFRSQSHMKCTHTRPAYPSTYARLAHPRTAASLKLKTKHRHRLAESMGKSFKSWLLSWAQQAWPWGWQLTQRCLEQAQQQAAWCWQRTVLTGCQC